MHLISNFWNNISKFLQIHVKLICENVSSPENLLGIYSLIPYPSLLPISILKKIPYNTYLNTFLILLIRTWWYIIKIILKIFQLCESFSFMETRAWNQSCLSFECSVYSWLGQLSLFPIIAKIQGYTIPFPQGFDIFIWPTIYSLLEKQFPQMTLYTFREKHILEAKFRISQIGFDQMWCVDCWSSTSLVI